MLNTLNTIYLLISYKKFVIYDAYNTPIDNYLSMIYFPCPLAQLPSLSGACVFPMAWGLGPRGPGLWGGLGAAYGHNLCPLTNVRVSWSNGIGPHTPPPRHPGPTPNRGPSALPVQPTDSQHPAEGTSQAGGDSRLAGLTPEWFKCKMKCLQRSTVSILK